MNTIKINNNLLKSFFKNDFQGYDPFDSLNSKLFQSSPFKNSKFCKLVFTQLGKRSFFNFRKLLLIPKSRNAKGIALVILGLIEDFKRTKEDYYLENAKILVDWLLANTCDKNKWKYNCWGYNFEWQAKAFNVPLGTPNIVTTYFASLAIYKFGVLIKDNNLQEKALNSAYFMSENLIKKVKDYYVFNYVPNYDAFVHNANLFGAYWCLLSGKKINDNDLVYKSISAIQFTINDQNSDGSWIYGHQSHHNWVDSFHTGYNLELIYEINKILNKSEYKEVINLGYQYYLKKFITNDGKVKYFNNTLYPLDVHSYAQAIITIIKLDPSNTDILNIIVKSLIKEMYIESEKRFRYQKGKFFSNNINYLRWTQAWAYYSLCKYNNLLNEKN